MPIAYSYPPYTFSSGTNTGGWYELGTFSSNSIITVADDERWRPWCTTSTTAANTRYTVTYNSEIPAHWWVGPRADDIVRAAQDIEAAADVVALHEDAFARRHSERRVAMNRAEELLLSLLSEEQQESYRHDQLFTVIGSHGTLYRIRYGVSGNIEWLRPDGEVGGRLCAHPTMVNDWLPVPDVLLSQVLALTTDERAFLQLANVHYGRRPELAVA